MTVYIANAFSLQMLPQEAGSQGLRVELLDDPARAAWEIQVEHEEGQPIDCAIGHPDLCTIARQQLDRRGDEEFTGEWLDVLQPSRISVELKKDDLVYVAQYTGPRLSEGATELPPDAEIRWWRILLDD